MTERDDQGEEAPDASKSDDDGSGAEGSAATPIVDHDLARKLAARDAATVRLLEAAEIRARRRPRAVFFVWVWELACALLVATPIHAWARSVWGAHPDGDAVLFRPGGHALLSWLGDDGAALWIVIRTSFLLLFVSGVLGQVVTGALVASLATAMDKDDRAPTAAFALGKGARAFYPLLGIGAIFGAVEALVLGAGLFVSSAIERPLQERIGDAYAFDVRLVVLAIFVAIMLVVGVIADLGRVAIAREVAISERSVGIGTRIREGVLAALRTARTALGRAALAWGWRAALGLWLVYTGALAGDAVGGQGGAALWLLFFVHQLIVLVRAALRVSWLANALRLVAG